MKQFLICISMLFCLSTIAYAGKVPLNYHPNGSTHGGNGKSPTSTWFILQEDNVLVISKTPCDYTLSLYDEDEAVVYSVFVPDSARA